MTLHSTTTIERQREGNNTVLLASSTFALGVLTGLLLKDSARQLFERVRNGRWHGDGRTMVYDENLPESLARREPAPEAGQRRFGGTGALGVSPASVVKGRPEEPET
jgi:hypothetical protein